MREGEPRIGENILESVLDRESPLTIQEIERARSEDFEVHYVYKGRKYQFGKTEVSILRKRIDEEDIKSEEHKEQILSVLRNKKEGEVYHHETLLVNILVEQARIARKFDIPPEGLYLSMKLNYSHTENIKILMSNFGDIYVLPFVKHIEGLKKLGASEQDIIIELAGHVFHEAIHIGEGGIEEALLGNKPALGEVTPITAQLAYYLEKGYHGPSSYDKSFLKRGMEKIYNEKDSDSNYRDYDIALCVAYELLLEQLSNTFPEVAASIKANNSADACEEIVSKIPPGKRDALIPCLKKAILESTDKKKFKEIIEKLKNKYKYES